MDTTLTITIEPAEPELIRRMELFERNGKWLSENGGPFYDLYRGQYIAVAGGEVFASPDGPEVTRLAQEAHPDDVPYVRYIPKQKYERIYAC